MRRYGKDDMHKSLCEVERERTSFPVATWFVNKWWRWSYVLSENGLFYLSEHYFICAKTLMNVKFWTIQPIQLHILYILYSVLCNTNKSSFFQIDNKKILVWAKTVKRFQSLHVSVLSSFRKALSTQDCII